MYGIGLLKGLKVTFKHWFQREVTEQYPEQRPDLPPASHYFFDYNVDKCIACGLCVRACPNQVIFLATEKDENNKKVVTDYTMKLGYCLYCGLCIEVCPTQALRNDPDFETSCYDKENLTFNFLEPEAAEHAAGFRAKQEAYWQKKRPEGSPWGMPEKVKPKKDPEAAKKIAAAKKAKAEAAKKAAAAKAAEADAATEEKPQAPAAEKPAPTAEAKAPAAPAEKTEQPQAPAEKPAEAPKAEEKAPKKEDDV